MTTFLKNIGQALTVLLILLIGLFFIILASPIIILLIVKDHFDNKAFKAEYQKYLETINHTNFFCYNSRANSKDYIENRIVPLLSADIKIIFVDGKTPVSDYEQKFISKALFSINNRKGFPYLLKISEGQLIDKSINQDFYNTMQQNKPLEPLIEKINLFFRTL